MRKSGGCDKKRNAIMKPVMPLRIFFLGLYLALLGTSAAVAEKARFELKGRVLLAEERPIRGILPEIRLEGIRFPFLRRTLARPDGTFKFKKIPASTYQLTISALGWGEMRRTLEVGPGTADARRQVEVNYVFEPSRRAGSAATVSTTQLSVKTDALEHYSRALKRLEKEDSAGAIKHLEKAVEISPHFSSAWNHLGTIAYMSRQHARAQQCFDKALEHAPDSYPALVNLGATLLALGKLEEALVTNARAVSLRAEEPLARSQLGLCYLRLGRPQEAEEQLKLAKKLDPGHFSGPQIALAEIYRRRRDFAAVAAEIEEFLRYHPDSPRTAQLQKRLQVTRDMLRQKQ